MIWPVRPTPLEGEIVRLEPLEEAHRAPLEREPETWTWIYRRIAGDPAAFRAWFDARLAATRDGTELCFVTRRRVEFKTDARNGRSRAALAALPATFEGVFRKHMVVPDAGVRDSAYYSIVDDDWPAVRQSLSGRLTRHAEAPAHA